MNSLFQQLNNRVPQNPMDMLMGMSRNNPQLASIIKEVQENGGDAKSLFYKKAQQMGVDPNMIINQLKNNG